MGSLCELPSSGLSTDLLWTLAGSLKERQILVLKSLQRCLGCMWQEHPMQNQVQMPKCFFIYLKRGQAETVLTVADRVMQIIQKQYSEIRSYIQWTESADIIQVRNQISGKKSKPKGSPIKATKHRENPKSNVKKQSGVQTQRVKVKQKTESKIEGRGTNREIRRVNTEKNYIKHLMIWYWTEDKLGFK